jgi:hypothetical protein
MATDTTTDLRFTGAHQAAIQAIANGHGSSEAYDVLVAHYGHDLARRAWRSATNYLAAAAAEAAHPDESELEPRTRRISFDVVGDADDVATLAQAMREFALDAPEYLASIESIEIVDA